MKIDHSTQDALNKRAIKVIWNLAAHCLLYDNEFGGHARRHILCLGLLGFENRENVYVETITQNTQGTINIQSIMNVNMSFKNLFCYLFFTPFTNH